MGSRQEGSQSTYFFLSPSVTISVHVWTMAKGRGISVGCCYEQDVPPHMSCCLELNSASGLGDRGMDIGGIFEP